jgi:hypothetical protein
MNIKVIREACCAQDDSLGPLTLNVELDENSTIQDLARSIGEAKFLQFSGTHNLIYAWSGGTKLFSIPALGINNSNVEYFVEKTKLAMTSVKGDSVECLWA